MKEKLFIPKSDLGEILEALAEEAIKHGDKLSTHATIAQDYKGTYLRVYVSNSATFDMLVDNTYYIVESFMDAEDIADDNITLALGKLKLAEQEAHEQEESTNNQN